MQHTQKNIGTNSLRDKHPASDPICLARLQKNRCSQVFAVNPPFLTLFNPRARNQFQRTNEQYCEESINISLQIYWLIRADAS